MTDDAPNLTQTSWVTIEDRYKFLSTGARLHGKTRTHVGKDTVRWAKCSEDGGKITNNFIGVGADGVWMFICTHVEPYRKKHIITALPPESK